MRGRARLRKKKQRGHWRPLAYFARKRARKNWRPPLATVTFGPYLQLFVSHPGYNSTVPL